MKRWNYIISVAMFAFALGVIFLSRSLHTPSKTGDPGADVWPLMLAGVLIFLACLLTVLTTVNSEKESQKTFSFIAGKYSSVYFYGIDGSLLCADVRFRNNHCRPCVYSGCNENVGN